ncbi:hypothetical protein ACIRL3_02685 [Streptomyces sp. NPDC102384]
MTGYAVDPETLQRVTKGINASMSELKELGFDIDMKHFADLRREPHCAKQ